MSKTTPNYDVFQINRSCKFNVFYGCFMAVCLGHQLLKLAARISEPFLKCLERHALEEHTT